ncbi:MAG TPA: alpha/beta hydrolase fold domain-containing protein, partial [Solirubrobacteraceae bacterium]|nr:alpha/beta hydrolase fold domain-containing protein [Solirubrobacteraceae bacterium]
EYNGDPNNVTLLGGSAGGQLVGMAALNLDTAAPNTVKGVVALSGPFDFVSLMEEDLRGETRSKSFSMNIPRALGCKITRPKEAPVTTTCTEEVEREWSPVDHVTACPRHWLMFNSENELIPLMQEDEMASALTAAGCTFTADVEPGEGHAFAYWSKVRPTITGFVND